jgi:glycosyltransferase involved in cell wall biosynthesis
MRLLYLSPAASMGGAERVLLNILTMVRRERPAWGVRLITGADGPLVTRARALGVETIVLPFPRAFARLGDSSVRGPARWIAFLFGAVRGAAALGRYSVHLRRAMAEFLPDAVHSNGFKMHILSALARPSRSALIWHFHDYLGSRRVTSRLIKVLKRRCSIAVAVSDSVATDVRHEVQSAFRVRMVWNSIDLDRYTPEGPSADLDALAGLSPAAPGVIRIGLVATFARWKGHLLFLDVMRALAPAYHVRGYIVGGPLYETDGSQFSETELRRAVEERGLEQTVGLTGFVEDTAAVFRNLDVVVHASTAPEPFGLVVAEAMAVGRPVVVSNAGGVAELVAAEQTGLVCGGGNTAEFAHHLRRLLDDPLLRRRLGGAAHDAAARQFDHRRVATQMLDVYASVLQAVPA